MRQIIGLAVIAMMSAGAAATALAQQGPAPVPIPPDRPTMEQSAPQPGPKPLFSLFGLPVVVNAPVAPPYCNCAMQNFGGQPARSRDAVAMAADGIRP